jgi:DNA-binding LytR/AlgR family response regulator
MKIAICDDKEEERRLLRNYCSKLGFSDLILFSSGNELLEYDQKSCIDLLFLDVEMPGISGIEVKNQFETECPSTLIVFCTTHTDSMIDAFGKNVVSFLNKPYDEHVIKTCLDRALKLLRNFEPVRIDQNLTVPCQEIIYLHAEQKYTIVYLTENRAISTRKSISQWIEELQELKFCLISRSTIVNASHILRIQDSKILLKNNMTLSASRRYIKSINTSLSG